MFDRDRKMDVLTLFKIEKESERKFRPLSARLLLLITGASKRGADPSFFTSPLQTEKILPRTIKWSGEG
jgi:hypothetical protein